MINHDSQQQVAIVTGANRGIGFECCRQLSKLGIHTILTSRSEILAHDAAKVLQQEGLPVSSYPMDVTDLDSVIALADKVSQSFERLDILINNAGIYLDKTGDDVDPMLVDISVMQRSMETNAFGMIRTMQKLIPLMNGSGNVVNVGSIMGQLSEMTARHPAYRTSKTAVTALTLIFADRLKDTGIKVNAVCPGWTQTEMGGSNAPRTVQEAVQTIIWLATLPADGPTGGFFHDGLPLSW